MKGKYLLCTLGCKVNQYESQQIREVVESLGYRPVSPGERHDFAIVNTCAVTADALRKSRGTIRRASDRGSTPVFVVGCGASADAERLSRVDGVAGVLGHDAQVGVELSKLLKTRLGLPSAGSHDQNHPATEAGKPRDSGGHDVWMIPGAQNNQAEAPWRRIPDSPHAIISTPLTLVKSSEQLLGRIESFAGHQRAFLKVQDGCDAHCTYCIIPQLRQTLRWKPVDVAVAEARALVQAGHKEIVITGIFLGAYGRSTALRKRFGPGPLPLCRLVDALAEVEGLERLRLSSLEPGDVNEDLLELIATRTSCVPHLHLPLQSGSPEILRRMNRQYTADAFIEMVDHVRESLDSPAMTTDIIVGFPGESDTDFEASIQMARYAGFSKIHAFPFSPRSKTAAARWQGEFVPKEVIRERMRRLAQVEAECSLTYRKSLLGRTERLIVEKPRDAESALSLRYGRTDRYFEVWFRTDEAVETGDVLRVRLDRVTPTRTHGTPLPRGGRQVSLFVLSNSLLY